MARGGFVAHGLAGRGDPLLAIHTMTALPPRAGGRHPQGSGMDKLDPATVLAADPDVVGCGLGEGSALLNLRSNIYYSLNEVGAFVWDQMSNPIAFGRLVQKTGAEFGAPSHLVEADLERLLAKMDEAGLIKSTRP